MATTQSALSRKEKARIRAAKWRAENLERARANDKAYAAANPERVAANKKRYAEANKEKIAARGKAFYEANKDRILVAHREAYAEDPTPFNTRSREWREKNPDRKAAADRAYEARKRALLVESVSPAAIFERDGGTCHLCLLAVDPADWHMDHVISLHHQGPHCADNLAVAHPSCNCSKQEKSGSADPIRWEAAQAAFEAFHEGVRSPDNYHTRETCHA